MARQRAHAHELELPLEEIDEHREFVEPACAQQSAPLVDPVVVLELAAVLKPDVLVHVGLQILGVGVHRAELVHADEIAVLADPGKLDERPAVGLLVPDGGLDLACQYEELPVAEAFVQHLEAGPVEPSQHLHAVVGAVAPLGDEEIQPPRRAQLGADPVPEVVHEIDELAEDAREALEYHFLLHHRRAGVAHEVAAHRERQVSFGDEVVEVDDLVELAVGVDELRIAWPVGSKLASVRRVHEDGARGEGILVFLYPWPELAAVQAVARLEHADHVRVLHRADVQLRPGGHTGLGVTLQIRLILEPDPRPSSP